MTNSPRSVLRGLVVVCKGVVNPPDMDRQEISDKHIDGVMTSADEH